MAKATVTQSSLNASRDHETPLAAPAVARSPSIRQERQPNASRSRNSSRDSTQIVKESVENLLENSPIQQRSSPTVSERPSAHFVPADNSDELYDATPQAKLRKAPRKLPSKNVSTDDTQAIAGKLFDDCETQQAGAASTPTKSATPGRPLSQLFSEDAPAPDNTARVVSKPRVFTQTTRSNEVDPAPATSAERPGSKASRNNSDQSSAAISTPGNPSANSKTSIMASDAKSTATAHKQSKSRTALPSTSAKAKLDALEAAETGKNASAHVPAVKATSTTQALVSVNAQAGASEKPTTRGTTKNVPAAVKDSLVKEQRTRPGKLTTLKKPMAGTNAPFSKDATVSDCAEAGTGASAQRSIKVTAKNDEKDKLTATSKHKRNSGPFVEDDDGSDTAGEANGNERHRDKKDDSIAAVKVTHSEAGTKRKARHVDPDEGDEDLVDRIPEVVKGSGALAGVSTKSKRQKQAVMSSYKNDEVDENDDDYATPKSPVKNAPKNTKKSKTASKVKAPSPSTARRPAGTTRGRVGANNNTKTPKHGTAVTKMQEHATTQESEEQETHDGSPDVVQKADQTRNSSVVRAVQSPQSRHDKVFTAAGSKVEGKKAVHRSQAQGSGMPARQKNPPPTASNLEGRTHDNAIMLSEGNDSSSSFASSIAGSPARETAITTTKDTTAEPQAPMVPKTPAPPMQSSPPIKMDNDAMKLAELQMTVRSNKSNGIGFDKSGPRNQGVASVKTPGPKSVKKMPVAPSITRFKDELKRKGGPSSFATSVRSGPPVQRASSSNLASNVDDALGNLRRKPAKYPLRMLPEPEDNVAIPHRQQHAVRTEVDPVEVDEFTNIDDYDDDDDTLVPMFSPPKSATPKLNAEQQVRPAPVKTRAANVRAGGHVQRQVHGGITTEPVTLEAVPPIPTQAGVSESLPQKPQQPAPSKPKLIADEQGVKLPSKRLPPMDQENRPAAKRSKADISDDNIMDHGKRRTRAVQGPLQPDQSPSQGKAFGLMPRQTEPGRPFEKSVPAPIQIPERTRPVRARLNRQTTNGSQRVDMCGSPVPPRMVVGHAKTVLETFSQQAGLVSDRDAVERTLKKHLPQLPAGVQQPENDLRYNGPQFHQPQPLSSNTKPVPAAPQADSAMVPRLELSESQSEKFLDKRDDLARMLNPFSGSKKDAITQGSEIAMQAVGGMAEQLDEQTTLIEDAYVLEEADGHTTMIRTKPNVQQSQRPFSNRTSSEDDGDLSDDDLSRLRAVASLTRRQPEEDPDRTLVNDDDSNDFRDQVGNVPNQEAQHGLEDPEFSDPASDDLMAWRKTLKPHQLNLSNELIKVAQRLTKIFVQHENSLSRNAENADRQNIYDVGQEEIARAQLYATKMEELRRLKRAHKKDLKKCQSNLVEQLEQKKKEQEEREVKFAQWEEENDNLESLVSKLS
ncbi:hypothetical protein CLAFUW4_10318 [Fulvia fulva]|uniref:Uncharacterized protein n=1 Tax=Passalora fulva TaxID=5499 RepID=A0A9Q8LG89_PASFU|nr:uncharacterized protein CLAFUR5_04931 [Fulvia fulva]KAK4615854.1 hypothetical protein CLAFUR4_10322 [Fulvia fulva]KAK4616758.1 hypothetical protein CLAFUR0_10320 [Fulvia fulva]UJO16629.1 hypothetical protein CLAFUR5_04931 [Fulvia fulva]WPV19535.1 hypothetical protein CLAFUW4_10318 [Fulvia fulva]WPV34403.1 hypothetical protein CLAFUW7_10318 [Fulvia fulva]